MFARRSSDYSDWRKNRIVTDRRMEKPNHFGPITRRITRSQAPFVAVPSGIIRPFSSLYVPSLNSVELLRIMGRREAHHE